MAWMTVATRHGQTAGVDARQGARVRSGLSFGACTETPGRMVENLHARGSSARRDVRCIGILRPLVGRSVPDSPAAGSGASPGPQARTLGEALRRRALLLCVLVRVRRSLRACALGHCAPQHAAGALGAAPAAPRGPGRRPRLCCLRGPVVGLNGHAGGIAAVCICRKQVSVGRAQSGDEHLRMTGSKADENGDCVAVERAESRGLRETADSTVHIFGRHGRGGLGGALTVTGSLSV